jgi:hypothetical protein
VQSKKNEKNSSHKNNFADYRKKHTFADVLKNKEL